jgi:manganese transport protein
MAIVPALIAIAFSGNDRLWGEQSVDKRLLALLVLSQVVLSFQLPFAIIPLIQFTSDRRRMGVFASRLGIKILAWACAVFVVGLNAVLINMKIQEWAGDFSESGMNPVWVYGIAGTLAVALAVFLGWLVIYPYLAGREEISVTPSVPLLPGVRFHRIGVAVEFEGADAAVLAQAASLARGQAAQLIAIHVVEGFGAAYYGPATDDQESRSDRASMEQLLDHLRQENLRAEGVLGYGNPAEELIRIADEEKLDLLVVGTHGHRFFADLALGQTVSPVLHRLKIPVLAVPTKPTDGSATVPQ